jgi:DNA-binding GntR family transcriptional regulator
MDSAKVKRLEDTVYEVLREQIVSGTRDGQVLIESSLALELGVSRTPVGSALIMLRERGLVAQRGARLVVPTRTLKDLTDLYECRLVMDALAAKLAALRITDTQVAALEAFLETLPEAEGAFPLWVADLRFHTLIYEVAANAHLRRFAQSALDMAAVYRRAAYRVSVQTAARTPEHIRREHQAILAALRARDPDGAAAAAAAHIDNVLTQLHYLHLTQPDVPEDTQVYTRMGS